MLRDSIKDFYYCKIKKMTPSEYNIFKMRRRGMIVGNGCSIYSDIMSLEPSMISIGNNVTIASGVKLITHDNAISKAPYGFSDLIGKVSIGDNCFIGLNVLIMPGVSIGNNSIVGAGSVVAKSVPDGYVVAGNPAKTICTTEEYFKRNKDNGMNLIGISNRDEYIAANTGKLIKKNCLNK